MNEPQPHEIVRCGAKNRQGNPCQRYPTPGMKRCRLHGGATPVGIASTNFRTGRFSRHLPNQFLDRIETILGDPDLRKVAKDIAVQRSLMDDILADLIRARGPERKAELRDAYQEAAQVLDNLLNGETRRYVQVQGLIPGTDAIRFFSVLTAKVQEQIMAWADAGRLQDPAALLTNIQDAIRQAVRTQPKVQTVIDAGA